MTRAIQAGVVLVAVLSLLGAAVGPCCTAAENTCSNRAGCGDAREEATLTAHCAPPAPLGLSAACCDTGHPASTDYVRSAAPQAGAPAPSGSNAPGAGSLELALVAPLRSVPPAPAQRSPILRL
jgi:hypothetical protein